MKSAFFGTVYNMPGNRVSYFKKTRNIRMDYGLSEITTGLNSVTRHRALGRKHGRRF